MYKEFYGLRENPFNLTPDPQFLFLSKKHADAFKYLIYGIRVRKGFILITGEVGGGKTTLCRALLDKLGKEVDSALILNPLLSGRELLGVIVEDLGMKQEGESEKELLEQLRNFLLRKLKDGSNVVIIIDEAQNLSFEVLERIRLLSNLETEKEKLLQIILVGQSELEEKLKKPQLRQVNQRIAIRYRLGPLKGVEIKEYIQHRLGVAGSSKNVSFTSGAINRIFAYSRGVPRVINMVCDRALLAGYYGGTKKITSHLVKMAICDLRGDYFVRPSRKRLLWGSLALVSILAVGTALWFQGKNLGSSQGEFLFPLVEVAAEKETPIKEANLIKQEEIVRKVEEKATEKMEIMETGNNYNLISLTVLLNLWGIDDSLPTNQDVPQDDGDDPLWLRQVAGRYGLEVSYFETDLEELRDWDIPCILSGVKDEGSNRQTWVVLLKVSDEKVTIFSPAKGRLAILREDLLKKWKNRAIIFWKDLDRIAFTLGPGMKGEEVRRLEERFKSLGYFKGIPEKGVYDGDLRQVVAHFQKEHGLKVDGIVGPQTKMALYHLVDHSAPGLSLE